MRSHPWDTCRATLAGLLRKAGAGMRRSEHLDGTDGETVFHSTPAGWALRALSQSASTGRIDRGARQIG
jgi:hypothetical protein